MSPLDALWAAFEQELREEFARNSHDPNLNYQLDSNEMTVRLSDFGGDGQSWLRFKVTEDMLRDPVRLARRLYAEARRPEN